jgi:hypothetical protein
LKPKTAELLFRRLGKGGVDGETLLAGLVTLLFFFIVSQLLNNYCAIKGYLVGLGMSIRFKFSKNMFLKHLKNRSAPRPCLHE